MKLEGPYLGQIKEGQIGQKLGHLVPSQNGIMKLEGTDLGQIEEGQIGQKLGHLVPSQNGIMKLEGTDLGQIEEGQIMYRDFATVSEKIVARDKEREL